MIKQSYTPYKEKENLLIENTTQQRTQLEKDISEFYKNNYYINMPLQNNFTQEQWRVHYLHRNYHTVEKQKKNNSEELLFIALTKLDNTKYMIISLNELQTNFSKIK